VGWLIAWKRKKKDEGGNGASGLRLRGNLIIINWREVARRRDVARMRKLGTLAKTQNESTTLNRRSLIRARCSRFKAQTRAGLRFDNKDRIEKYRRWTDAGVSRGVRDEIAERTRDVRLLFESSLVR